MKKILLITLLAIAGAGSIVQAQRPTVIVSDKTGWHRIGKTTVNFQKERDAIDIIGSNRFSAIQFKVEDAPISLQEIYVYYSSGDKQTINVNEPIKAPGESRIIDLNGGERNLKKVAFVYRTLPNRKDVKAHLEIWGLKTNTNKM